MISRRYHLPATVDETGTLPRADADRLAAVVLAALRRAVDGAAPERLLPAGDGGSTAGLPREAFSAARASAGDDYAIPSYDRHGRPIRVPLHRRGGVGAAVASSTGPVVIPFRLTVDRELNSDELLLELLRQWQGLPDRAAAEQARASGDWHWTGTPSVATAEDVRRGYKIVPINDLRVHRVDAAQRERNQRELQALPEADRAALDAEADRRFRERTHTTTDPTGRPAEDRANAAYRDAIRDDLLSQRAQIAALPAGIRNALFDPDAQQAVQPADYDAVLAAARTLASLSPEDVARYRETTAGRTMNAAELADSVARYARERGRVAATEAWVGRSRTALFDLRDLYRLYKQWRSSQAMSGVVPAVDEYGVRDPAHHELRDAAQRLDADFRAALHEHGLATPADFEGLISEFRMAFERRTTQFGLDALNRYEHLLFTEEQRISRAGATAQLSAAIGASVARQSYAEADRRTADAGMFRPDPELHRYLPGEWELKRRSEGEAERLRATGDAAVVAAAGSPLVSAPDFNRVALARAGPQDVLGVFLAYISEHRDGINTTRRNLLDEQDFVYRLPELIDASLRAQDIAPDSVYAEIVADELASRGLRRAVVAIVLAVVTIAIGLLTAGTGLAVVGAVAVFGIGTWQAVDTYRDYAREHAAYEAGLLADDPSFGWVIAAAIGAGIDLGGVVEAIRPARAAIEAFNAGGDLLRFENQLQAARLEQRLASNLAARARAQAGFRAAGQELLGVTGRLNAGAPLDAAFPLAKLVYHVGRGRIADLDRFVLELRASRLIASGALSPAAKIQLRAGFAEATEQIAGIRALGRRLRVSDEAVEDLLASWAAIRGQPLSYVEQEIRALAAGAGMVSRRVQRGFLQFRLDAPPEMWRLLDAMPEGYAVYRVRNAGGEIIYVGITGRAGWDRWLEHLADKGGEWIGQAHRFEFVGVGLPERGALALEDSLMRHYSPPFNRQWTYYDRFHRIPEGPDIPTVNTSIILQLTHE